MKKHFTNAAAFLGVGAGIFAIFSILFLYDKHATSVLGLRLDYILLSLGSLFFFLGFIFLWMSATHLIKWGFNETTLYVIDILDCWHFEACPASEDDLEKIHEMACNLFGEDVSPITEMKSWHKRNNKIFWAVRRKNETELMGYFCVIPLLKRAAKLVEKEDLTGAHISVKHITSSQHNSKPYAIYVGAIAAKNLLAQGAAMNHLTSFFQMMHSSKVRNIYTRPVTKIGLKRSLERGFKPVDKRLEDTPLNRTYYLNTDALTTT